MTHPANVQDILRQAAILVGNAEALGVTLRINPEPLQPLAMGNTHHVIEAWPARHPPTPLQAAGPLWKTVLPDGPVKEAMSDREWAAQPANMREGCTVRVPGVGEL